jgi:hypothetical protein
MDNLKKLKNDFHALKNNFYISEKQEKFIQKYFDMCFCLGIDYVNENIRPKNDRQVCKMLNGKITETFETIAKAAKNIKVDSSSISHAIKKNHKSGGYYWQYADKI